MSINYEWPTYSRLKPRTTWTNSRITNIDLLPLDEAAKFATKHAGTEITASDFLRAASRGEIRLRATIHRNTKVRRFDGGIYCNAGMPTENLIEKGVFHLLPISACRQLANAGRASWRTIDGHKMIDGVLMRYEVARLTDDEPDFETILNDCRVIGEDVHALADAFLDTPKEADTAPQDTPAPASNIIRITRNKLRTNLLDVAIKKAIKLADSLDAVPVYLELRELALSGEKPFTGMLDGDALCYTNDKNKPAKLTKNALIQRLKRLREQAG